MFISKDFKTEQSLFSQHNLTTDNNNQRFNTRQQQYYCVTDELKSHNLCSKYPPFSVTQMWICMSHLRHSVAVTLSRISGDRT